MTLNIATRIQPLPSNAVTQTFGIIGRKGSGKTYAAGKLVEEMLDDGGQVVIMDPLGNWYGLRLNAKGKKSGGIPIPIFGGDHGDIPLVETAGAMVAELIVREGISAVLDLSPFSGAARRRFVTDFAVRLFELKKAKRTPLHLVLEEAHLFAPQMSKGQEHMLGAIEHLVRLGRNFGIGVTMIDQRPQSVNKEVLNQVECLMVFQLTGPHERKAIKGWIVEMGADVLELVDALPSLEVGECFLWSPQWLKILERVKIKKKRTFDSTSTPEAGYESATEQKTLADIDIAKIQEQMARVEIAAQDSDPKLLRKRVKDLLRANAALEKGRVDHETRLRAEYDQQLAEQLDAAPRADPPDEKKIGELFRTALLPIVQELAMATIGPQMTHPTGTWHTSELTCSCPQQAKLRLEGQELATAETALFRGLLAGEACGMVHTRGLWDPFDTQQVVSESCDLTLDGLRDESRSPTAAVLNGLDKIQAEVAKHLTEYQVRFAEYFRSCELLGTEVPCRITLDVEGEPIPFESHMDLLYRGPDPIRGGEPGLIFWDWKWRDKAPSRPYLARNLQFGLYSLCTGRGEVMLDAYDGWQSLGEWPSAYWCHLPDLKPYCRKTTVKEWDENQNGYVDVEYTKGDRRPMNRVLVNATHNDADAIEAALVERVRMADAGFWPAIATPEGCRFCNVKGSCKAFGGW